MKKTTALILTLLALLVIVVPFLITPAIAMLLPSQYDYTLNGGLDEKYDRLISIEEEKIVVVGGSSVAFGLDSKKLESYTGMPVVNFGLYADLGTKLMLDLSRDGIGEGDVIVLAPELDPQTLSLFFSSENTLRALDGNFSMMWRLPVDDILSLAGGMWSFSYEKLANLDKAKPDPEGAYNSKNLNEYGDLVYERADNVMLEYYDCNKTVNLTPEALDSAEFREFCDYVNSYIRYAERKGATVLFSYCPINEWGLADGVTAESIAHYTELLEKNIDCTFISDIGDYIMEPGYFYDTNFHLNDTGVALRTARLARDIRFECEITAGVLPRDEPEAPALPGADMEYDGYDENEAYFTFELRKNRSYAITGLTELGKTQQRLTIPVCYDGRRVTAIGAGALSGGVVTELVVTEHTSLRVIENRSISDAPTLIRVFIYKKDPNTITPPSAITGVHSDFRFHTPDGSNYSEHYDWGDFREIIIEDL